MCVYGSMYQQSSQFGMKVVEFNIEAAQQGNVYIDEVDKITKKAESMDINVFRICDTNYDSRGCTEAYVASTENPEAFLIKVLQGILQKNGKIRSSFSKDVFDSHGYDISDYYDEIGIAMEMMKQGATTTVLRLENYLLKCWSRDCKACDTNRLLTWGTRERFKRIDNLAESNHAGIVERVVLGVPTAIQDENWIAARK
ncbi:hypothetical protein Tco_1023217, partial [Tanacetum coccineum]